MNGIDSGDADAGGLGVALKVEFSSRIQLRGVNPFILVSRRRAHSIRPSWRRPLPVVVRMNGRATPVWRTSLMPAGDGNFYLYLHGALRKATESAVGDRVRVELRFDPTYRGGPQQPMPRWFAAALRGDRRAAAGWNALSPSRKKEIVRYFAGLKSSAPRARNLERAMHVLAGGRGRFMGRDWASGS
ncbi:MAG TPA: YdeI/OmpD-associated family protein [Thermoplasmata archaeon]|nr:YdeI/OmpD-associated family protein [Thermoplasmata archaeon]